MKQYFSKQDQSAFTQKMLYRKKYPNNIQKKQINSHRYVTLFLILVQVVEHVHIYVYIFIILLKKKNYYYIIKFHFILYICTLYYI